MRIARQVINGRIPLIVGVGAIRTEDCIEFGLAARRQGADAILMPAPYYAAPTQLELINHALAVDCAVNLPIMLYNYPGRTGTVMRRPFFERVGRSPNFAAVKESTGDINQLHMLAREFPHIELLCGMDDQALEFFAWAPRAGSAPAATACRLNIWRFIKPLRSRTTLQGVGGSCRRLCRSCASSNRAAS